jgi:hypothetical protein
MVDSVQIVLVDEIVPPRVVLAVIAELTSTKYRRRLRSSTNALDIFDLTGDHLSTSILRVFVGLI